MDTEKSTGSFPVRKIKVSLIVAAVIFALGGIIMKNQAFFSVQLASLAASFGYYDTAIDMLGNIDMDDEADYYNKGLYNVANTMYDRGDYNLASEKFTEIVSYSDCGDMVCKSNQKIAERLIKSGDYKEASAILSEIMYFDGSRELYNECQYQYALEEIEKGEWFVGAQILWSIKEYKDSKQKAEKAVYENTGSTNAEETLGSGKPISPEMLSEYLKLTEKRAQLRDGCIAVGFYHTVGLNSNGRVVACGNNNYGQCNTSSWRDIIQIAAGGYHTVGLCSDGTVVACGKTEGLC